MMQYNNWNITIFALLPFYKNFCSYMLCNAIFVIFASTSQYYMLLFAVEYTDVKIAVKKLNYIPAKIMDKMVFCTSVPLTANYSSQSLFDHHNF